MSTSNDTPSSTDNTPLSPNDLSNPTTFSITRHMSQHRVNDGLAVSTGAPKTDHFQYTFKSDLQNLQEKEQQIVVLKIGSSSISGSDGRIKLSVLSQFVEMACNLIRDGFSVIVVTSGAVSVGCNCLGMTERPTDLITKQACSAVGMGRLMRMYDDLFSLLGQPIAQVLLSRENLSQQHHYLNSMNTFLELIKLGVVPIVNENDTVAVQELKFGDNDNLSALVGSVVRAHWVFLLTDVDALYTSNPRNDPDAKAIRVVEDISSLMVDTSGTTGGASGQWGTGGMATKLQAASVACNSGCHVSIVSTDHMDHVSQILQGSTDVGTTFLPSVRTLAGRKKWIAFGLVPVGTLIVDAGAARALSMKTSLFAVGIMECEGNFPCNSAVRIINPDGVEIGRGISNYSSDEIQLIKGHCSGDYSEVLGYNGPDSVITRGNVAVFPSAISPSSSTSNLAGLSLDTPDTKSATPPNLEGEALDVIATHVLGFDTEVYGTPVYEEDLHGSDACDITPL